MSQERTVGSLNRCTMEELKRACRRSDIDKSQPAVKGLQEQILRLTPDRRQLSPGSYYLIH